MWPVFHISNEILSKKQLRSWLRNWLLLLLIYTPNYYQRNTFPALWWLIPRCIVDYSYNHQRAIKLGKIEYLYCQDDLLVYSSLETVEYSRFVNPDKLSLKVTNCFADDGCLSSCNQRISNKFLIGFCVLLECLFGEYEAEILNNFFFLILENFNLRVQSYFISTWWDSQVC